MCWLRHIGGRLESRYRYSIGLVYNTFPWPPMMTTEKLKGLGPLAQAVLTAARCTPQLTLADLYDPDLMPVLRKAHRDSTAQWIGSIRRPPSVPSASGSSTFSGSTRRWSPPCRRPWRRSPSAADRRAAEGRDRRNRRPLPPGQARRARHRADPARLCALRRRHHPRRRQDLRAAPGGVGRDFRQLSSPFFRGRAARSAGWGSGSAGGAVTSRYLRTLSAPTPTPDPSPCRGGWRRNRNSAAAVRPPSPVGGGWPAGTTGGGQRAPDSQYDPGRPPEFPA